VVQIQLVGLQDRGQVDLLGIQSGVLDKQDSLEVDQSSVVQIQRVDQAMVQTYLKVVLAY